MFGKWILLFFTLSLFACAQPKYVKAEGDLTQEQSEGGQRADLSLPFQSHPLYLSWYWEKKPTASDTGSIIFKTYRPNAFDQSAVPTDWDGDLSVLLWMPGMGHGSSPTSVERLDIGTFRASQVFFVMPGEWDIHFQLKKGKAVEDEVVVRISF